MFTKYILPLLAVAGLAIAGFHVYQMQIPPEPSRPIAGPPTPTALGAEVKPRPRTDRADHEEFIRTVVAGAGLVEAKRENIPIGATIPGVVTEVFVKIHDMVKKGDPLFRVDDRDLKAELKVRKANLEAARAQLARLEVAPQGGMDVKTARAAVEEAQAHLNDSEVIVGRDERLLEKKMIPASDYDKDKFAFYAAKASLARARADLERIEATWEQDKKIARAAVIQAESQVESVETNLERCTVRALVDGEILQVHVRPGQHATVVWNEPLIILGDVQRLHVRVDIDEQDLPWYKPGTPAIATLKGRPGVQFPLEFVKVEPYVIPKKSLTGDNSERVDTRVLQAIYALPDQRPIDVYVGMQMDVFLKAVQPPKELALDTGAAVANPFDGDGVGEK
jgi:multidrug resistance efflux pump